MHVKIEFTSKNQFGLSDLRVHIKMGLLYLVYYRADLFSCLCKCVRLDVIRQLDITSSIYDTLRSS